MYPMGCHSKSIYLQYRVRVRIRIRIRVRIRVRIRGRVRVRVRGRVRTRVRIISYLQYLISTPRLTCPRGLAPDAYQIDNFSPSRNHLRLEGGLGLGNLGLGLGLGLGLVSGQ